jgi:hypothetical protein
MNAVETSRMTATGAFPVAAVEAALRGELLAAVQVEASLRGAVLPANPSAAVFEIDSLVVVDLLCALEPLMGFEIQEDVVRAGGYDSIEDAVRHLMPTLEREWIKRRRTAT